MGLFIATNSFFSSKLRIKFTDSPLNEIGPTIWAIGIVKRVFYPIIIIIE